MLLTAKKRSVNQVFLQSNLFIVICVCQGVGGNIDCYLRLKGINNIFLSLV